jgi:murein DD-endopeptidase MepM/ murein hydrolase activator NlpD
MENKKIFFGILILSSIILNLLFFFLFLFREREHKLELNVAYNLLLNNCENEIYNSFSNYRAKDLQKIFETANKKTLNQLKNLRIEIKTEIISNEELVFFNPLGQRFVVTSWKGFRKQIERNTGGFTAKNHMGLDLVGTKNIFATFAGRVKFAGWKKNYGQIIIIQHRNGYESRYAHLAKIFVKSGDFVYATEKIGEMGETGNVTGKHLHFEIRKHGKIIDMNRLFFKNEFRKK